MGKPRDGVQHGLEEEHVVGSGCVVHFGVHGSSCGSSLCSGRSGGVEGGREALLGLVEHCAGVADGDADELQCALDCYEGRDEGGVLLVLLFQPFVEAEVLAECGVHEDEGALLPVEGGSVPVGGVRNPAGVDEVRRNSIAVGEEVVGDVVGEDPVG